MRLYFARHGESEANVLRVISNRGYVHGLTARGVQQAEQLVQRFAAVPLARIYTSPLRRAVETGQIVARALGVALETTDALREFDCGIAEGRADPDAWALLSQITQTWLREGRWEQRIEGGESVLDMRRRFQPFLTRLLREGEGRAENVLLISHGGVLQGVLPLALLNVSPAYAAAHGFGNTATVLAETTPAGLVCREWCGEEMAEQG
jgi:broad specificity phosphatase PhoE